MSGKPLFPLNPDYEDDRFQDPDTHFKDLPYHDEIPELSYEGLRLPPLHYHYYEFKSCREKLMNAGVAAFVVSLFTFGRYFAFSLYGYSIGRYRLLLCELGFSTFLAVFSMVRFAFADPICSPYLGGRRRPLAPEETIRHALNARYHLFESVDLIMHSRQLVTKYDFFQVMHGKAAKYYEYNQPNDI